jgi:hypothetical protein
MGRKTANYLAPVVALMSLYPTGADAVSRAYEDSAGAHVAALQEEKIGYVLREKFERFSDEIAEASRNRKTFIIKKNLDSDSYEETASFYIINDRYRICIDDVFMDGGRWKVRNIAYELKKNGEITERSVYVDGHDIKMTDDEISELDDVVKGMLKMLDSD